MPPFPLQNKILLANAIRKITSRNMPTYPHEEFRLNGDELLAKVKELINEGSARRLIIKNEREETVLEIPLAIGAVGALIAPVLAAVGALAALMTKCTIVVVKKTDGTE